MKKITYILLLTLIGITVSCTQWVLPEACNEPTPTSINVDNNATTKIVTCTVGNSSAAWIVKNSVNEIVKPSSGATNNFTFGATDFPPGDYIITASGITACGFRFEILKTYTVICTGSSPTDIAFVPSIDKLTTVCTLVSTDNLIGDNWTLVDKISGKRTQIANGINVSKVTITSKDYPSANYTLEVTGKTKCGTIFKFEKDFKVDYFDLLDFKIPSNAAGLRALNTKVGINGDIYVVGTSENFIHLLKYNKYGIFTSSIVIATISTDRFGGSSIIVNDVKIDDNDNIYITGNSRSGLGPNGPGALFGTFQTIQGFFVAKYNANGVIQWVKCSDMLQTTSGNSISIAPDGSVYMIGDFSGNNLSVARHEPVNAVGKNDIFVVKYTQGGSFIWISSIGGIDNDSGVGIATSSNGDAYITGYSADLSSLKFNKSGAIANSKFGGNDIFIIKLGSSGIPTWVKTAGGTGDDIPTSIVIDINNNVYFTGSISSSATFGNVSVSTTGTKNLFLSKYNTSGEVVWAKSGISEGNVNSNQIIVDALGNSYIVGEFDKSLTLGNSTKKSVGLLDGYVAKYSTDGTVQWVESIGGAGNDYLSGFGFDNGKNILTTIRSSGLVFDGRNYSPNSYLWRLDK